MRSAILAGLIAIATSAAAPSSASAACPELLAPTTFSTSWKGGDGHYNTDANWTNGVPTGLCDASITAAGTYTVTMNGGSNAKSMTIGGAGSTPTLEIRAEGANTNLAVGGGGFLDIKSGAAITLRCNPSPACGSPNVSAPTITNAGTFTVESTVNGTPFISGPLTNTGAMNFNHTAKFDNGAVTNQGTVNIADATTVLSGGSSCGDTSISFKNDTGGTLNVTGTGTFDVINYEQGAGAVAGTSTNPVQIPCGSVKFTGSGASKVRAYGGFTLTGTMQSNQSLAVSPESSNTNAILGGNFTNNGSISLTCTNPCSSGAGAGFNVNDKDFVNAGTFTVAAASGTGASVGANSEGTITNTGTMQFDQSAGLGGPVTNQGAINIADTKVATSSGSSCGDTGASVKNDTGGSINGTGTGTLSVINYEQGAGSTTGSNPVQMPCGSLKYTGSGASKVLAYGGFTLTGTMQSNQSLTVTDASSNTAANLGGPFTNNGTITLTCPLPVGTCGAGGGADFNGAGQTFTNAGTLTVSADAGTGVVVNSGGGGTIVNTGTINFDQSGALAGVIDNQGAINIADTKAARNEGSSCGDAGHKVSNNTGGSINGIGSGTLRVINYEQGAGTTTGTAPVQIPCGSVKYLGSGASLVQARGGLTLSGTIQNGQTLDVSGAENNPTVTVSGPLTNNGTVLFTCPGGGCAGGAGGGGSWNGAGNAVVNAGTITFAASTGTGGGIGTGGGTLTNTGTMNFDQSGGLSGVVTNQGEINIADGKTATSTTGHCGDSGPRVINDTGGEINSTGTGTLSAVNFEQGAGTTSGTTPVTMNCGSLKYVGGGASSVLVPGGNSASLTGNLASGQTVRVAGTLHSGSFSNAGTILFDQSLSSPNLNLGGTLTNTGTIETSGASVNTSNVGGTIDQTGASAQVVIPTETKLSLANPLLLKAGKLSGGGTLQGSVNNSGGTVAPGASPGTLTLSGNYEQSADGSLGIEVEGTGAGQFDRLVVGGNANLGGTASLQPTAGYAASAAIGDSLDFLTYGGTRTGVFASTTVSATFACPKQLAVTYDDTAKEVNASVSGTGAPCPPPDNGGGDNKPPPAVNPPDTVLGAKPKARVKSKKAKAKIKFTFSSSTSGATFECKLDKAAFAPCTSPKSFKAKRGKHTFSVRAIAGGVADPTPASFSFKVVKKKKR